MVEVATALFDTNRPHVRDAAAVALRTALAENPSLIEPFTKTMIDKSGLTADQSESVLALLRGPDLAERKSAEVLRRLVDGIMADVLPIRELSHRVLLLEVDPESIRNPVLARFDPLGSTESREACQKLWRKRVDELIK